MKNLSFIALIVVALVQLATPAKMVYENEIIVTSGKVFKFKTAPVDPSDPFRGKYVFLQFEAESFEIPLSEDWENIQDVFVQLREDTAGYAAIENVLRKEPGDGNDFVKAKLTYVETDSMVKRLHLDFPFNRFYMEESKAGNAEHAVWEASRDTGKITYALVSVKDGNAVVTDVRIDDESVIDLSKKNH